MTWNTISSLLNWLLNAEMKLSDISWNLTGLILPLAVAVVTVPTLVERLGQERFGILALAWGLIGYAGALDLGIGRAVTQKVGSLIAKGDSQNISAVLATASKITLASGLIGSFAIAFLGLFNPAQWIKSAQNLEAEIQICVFLLAIALPAQAMSATYKGLNEAFLNFKWISVLRAVLGVINFGGPYLISLITNQLYWVIGSLVISRILALLIYRRLAFNCLHENKQQEYKYSKIIAKSLFSFGGWITVSSVLSPILVQADRFVIASTISAAAVYVYVLPYEVVVQSLVLVGAISSVIFPNLSRLIHGNSKNSAKYFRKWLLRVAVVMSFVCVTIFFSLPYLLPLWIKENLNQDSVIVGKILCVGVFANSIASMYFAFIHAKGRSDITAKIHICELPIFMLLLLLLTQNFGVQGAAWAWAMRMVVDCISLGLANSKINP